MSITIKIRKETAQKLAKLLGELTSRREEEVSYDELINYLIDLALRSENTPPKDKKELSPAARKLLKIMEQPREEIAAGSEDFREYEHQSI